MALAPEDPTARSGSTEPGSGYGWIPLFEEVEEEQLTQLLRGCEVLRLSAGTELLHPGEANDSIYVLLAGDLTVYLSPEACVGQGIAIQVGQCTGEFSAIDRKPVSALVRCEGNARVLRLSGPLFWEQLIALPGVARNLMRGLTERARTTNGLALEAQRQRLELDHLRKELELARRLQASMLPLRHPLFPDRPDLDVCALVEPAARVGGDFFDAFLLGDGRLFICIGDVSGHGIGAALLMARTIGLLRSLAMTAAGVEAVLQQLNASLSEGNDTCLFVTLFCGCLDPANGHFLYANAGHCPPLLVRGEAITELPLPRGPLAGAFPEARYSSAETLLERGDLLFAYTDGITEAEDPEGNPFGIEGCRRRLQQLQPLPLPQMLEALRGDLSSYTAGAGQEDDCTMLLLRWS